MVVGPPWANVGRRGEEAGVRLGLPGCCVRHVDLVLCDAKLFARRRFSKLMVFFSSLLSSAG